MAKITSTKIIYKPAPGQKKGKITTFISASITKLVRR